MADKIKVIVAALMIISALGVVTLYDDGGNVIVSNATHDVIIGNDTKVIDYSKINENTTIKTVYEGTRTISDAIAASAATKDTAVVLKKETEKVMSAVSFPYNVTKEETKTTFKILKYRCDEKMGICGYWIEAWRDGKEVYTNSPIWLGNHPYTVTVSKVYDEKTNEQTITLKEDPKIAVEEMLQRYVDGQPLGKPVVGTKE